MLFEERLLRESLGLVRALVVGRVGRRKRLKVVEVIPKEASRATLDKLLVALDGIALSVDVHRDPAMLEGLDSESTIILFERTEPERKDGIQFRVFDVMHLLVLKALCRSQNRFAIGLSLWQFRKILPALWRNSPRVQLEFSGADPKAVDSTL